MAQPPVAHPLTYLHDIPSLHESHQGVPAMLGTLDLDRGILAEDAINPNHLAHAKKVAKALKVIHEVSINNQITAAVVNSAELRAAAIEAAHVFTTYKPVNMEQVLQNVTNQLTAGFLQVNEQFHQVNQQFNQVNRRLDEAVAISRNTRVLAHNHRQVPNAYLPIYKTILGDGLNLAINIYGNIPGLQGHLVAPAEAQQPVVGTVPPNFSNNFTAYTWAEFVRLIIFYNEDFGIVAGDTVPTCIDKFHLFLTTY